MKRDDPMRLTSDFPILDGVPQGGPDRTIIDALGVLEPYVAESDSWCALPVRLVRTQAAGLQFELGPYTLDAADICTLRAAIAAYDAAFPEADA